MSNTNVPGYEQPWGTKEAIVTEHFGPASYPTGGETINASDFNRGGFDAVLISGISYSGTYSARWVWALDAAPSVAKGAQASGKLLWTVVATGSEVANTTDLSTEILRLLLIMV